MEHTTKFPLHRGNELVIKFSNSSHHQQQQQQHKIFEDQILDDHYASLVVNNSNKIFNISSSSQQKELFYHEEGDNDNKINNNIHHDVNKKMVHREIERQRRQEMATYCESLRSLLPLQYIKGKRSISDHMNEAVNYIKYMQNNINELGAKRDKLKKLSNSKLENLERNHTNSHNFFVHENSGIMGIEITSGLREERLKISELLQLLLQEGLEVVSCISTEVNGRLLTSVNCEVNNSRRVDLFELRKKIGNVFSTFTCCD